MAFHPQSRYCPLDDSLWILYIMEFDVDAKIVEKLLTLSGTSRSIYFPSN
jgi:hypothetical protein